MFTRPDDLDEGRIRAELAAGWNFAARALSYLPVGFGSHHWLAADAAGRQLFLIVHDLPRMLHSRLDTAEAAFGRLEVAFECAVSLRRDANLEFVIAPVPAVSGEVVRPLAGRYSLAVCPYLTGCEPGQADEFPAGDLPAVVRLLTELHRAAPLVAPPRCDFGLPKADGLRAAIGRTGEPWRTGRYGEPDPRNVLKTPVGFVIVDWDFVQLAPPERDLWDLAETDRSVLAAYTEATGITIDSGALDLFRMRYDLSEIAEYIELFRGAHDDTGDTAESWKNLEYYLRPAERWPRAVSIRAAGLLAGRLSTAATASSCIRLHRTPCPSGRSSRRRSPCTGALVPGNRQECCGPSESPSRAPQRPRPAPATAYRN